MSKLTANQKEFEKQVKRLMKITRQAEREGIKFIERPIPEEPKRITKQYIEKLKSIKPLQVKEMGYTVNDTGELEPYKAPKTKQVGTLTGGSRRHPKTVNEIMRDNFRQLRRRHGGGRPKGEPKEKVYKTKEELKQIRSEASKKAWQTRKEAGWESKAKPKTKLTAEELKKIRSEASKKAWQTRKDAGWKSKAKPKTKLTAEELKKIRSEAVKKSWQTRKKREAEDPEYKKRIDETRRSNLEKARLAKRANRKNITDEEWKRIKQEYEYEKRRREQEQNPEIEAPEIEAPTDKEEDEKRREQEQNPDEIQSIFDIYYREIGHILEGGIAGGGNSRTCTLVLNAIDGAIIKYGQSWFVNKLKSGELGVIDTNAMLVSTDDGAFYLVEAAEDCAWASDDAETIVRGAIFVLKFFLPSLTVIDEMWDVNIKSALYDAAKEDLKERFGR